MTSTYILEDSFFRTLLEAAPDAILVCDKDGSIVIANDQCQTLFGYTRQELVGQKIELIVPSPIKAAHVSMRERYFSSPHRRPMGMGLSLNAEAKDKSLLPVEISLSPVKVGDDTYVVAVVRDVTELRKLDRELKKNNLELKHSNEELERFAYVASHDLKEPLRVIASYTSLIKRRFAQTLGPEGLEYLDLTTQSVDRMQELISDLLTYSKLSTKTKDFEPVPLNQVLAQVMANIQVLVRETHATINIHDLPVVCGDRIQLIQVFQNLVTNGIKFMQKGVAPVISISALDQNDRILIQVKDNGIGIPKQEKDRVFTIFQRLHTREEYPGTGIGLAICKKVIDRHHGEIWFESAPGEGTTFFIALKKST